MAWFLGGLAALAITGFTFWFLLPQNGQVRSFVGTTMEPYIGVAIAGAAVMSVAAMVRGLGGMFLPV